MFLDFFFKLKNSRIPVTINEFFTFLEALKLELIQYDLTPESIVNNFSKISSEPEHYHSYLAKINDSMRGEGFEVAAEAINNIL